MQGSLLGLKSRRKGRSAIAIIVITALVVLMTPGAALGGWWRLNEPELVSATPTGEPGNNDSWYPHISDDGRMVTFDSDAYDLSEDDATDFGTGEKDVFVRDMFAGECDLVSLAPTTALDPTRGARENSISDDGRFVTLYTGKDLVTADTNGDQDLYVKDLETGEYTMATLGEDGSSPGRSLWDVSISGDGRFVAFTSDQYILGMGDPGEYLSNVFVWDIESDETTLVSDTPAEALDGDRGARFGAISDDGRYVAFFTGRDFLPEDENGGPDLYIKDMSTGEFTLAHITVDGSSPGDSDFRSIAMSGDGSAVVFETDHNLVPEDDNEGLTDVYYWDMASDETTLVSAVNEDTVETDRGSRSPTISDDGRLVAFFSGKDFVLDDVNGEQDVYLKDMETGEFRRIVITPDGSSPGSEVGGLAMSGDGNWLAFDWREIGVERLTMGAAYEDPSATGEIAPTKDGDDRQVYVVNLTNNLEPGDTRIEGDNRFDTSVAVSEETFPFGAGTVVIATGANWPDALCSSALAGAVVGPVLLTSPDALPQSVIDELDRLGAEHAYIVGGTSAVSEDVEDELNELLPGYVNRLAGDDRYGTSRAVANRVIDIVGATYSGMACVTTGDNYPDALAAAPLAAGLDWPILLARPDTGQVYLPADTTDVMLLGGEAAVPAAIEAGLKTELGDEAVVRVGGDTRYETAALAAQFGVDAGLLWNGVGVASGASYPDALAGGAATGLQRSVIVLTPPTTLDPYAEAALEGAKDDIDTIRFFGGSAALSTAVENAVLAILGM